MFKQDTHLTKGHKQTTNYAVYHEKPSVLLLVFIRKSKNWFISSLLPWEREFCLFIIYLHKNKKQGQQKWTRQVFWFVYCATLWSNNEKHWPFCSQVSNGECGVRLKLSFPLALFFFSWCSSQSHMSFWTPFSCIQKINVPSCVCVCKHIEDSSPYRFLKKTNQESRVHWEKNKCHL